MCIEKISEYYAKYPVKMQLLEIEQRFKEVAGLEINLTMYPLEKSNNGQSAYNRERAKAHGEVFTPLWLVDGMLGRVSSETMLKGTLDLCSGYGQFTIRILRRLYNEFGEGFNLNKYLSESHFFNEIQEESCAKLRYIFGNEINLFECNAMELKNNGKTFEVIFSNPPYNRNIDLKILKEVFPLAKELVIVHPGNWILDRKNKAKLYVELKNTIGSTLKSAEFFNGNPVFGIALFVPCVITHINKTYRGNCSVKYFEDEFTAGIGDITKFGKAWLPIVKPFMEKMVSAVASNE